jgi:pentalenic acid synthase
MTSQAVRYPFVEQPVQVLRALRPHAPIVEVSLWNGKRAWLLVRHADAIRALTDPRLSADMADPNFPSLNPSQMVPNNRAPISRIDNARHRQLRELVASKFTARAARRWRPVAEGIVAERLAALLRDGPPVDLVKRFALPLPLRLICHLVGVPERDVDFVMHHGQMVVTRAQESSRHASEELYGFFDRMVRDNEVSPQEGLVGQLVVEHLRAGAITREELVTMAVFLLVAGQTTMSATIGLSVLSLLEEPARYRALHDNPALVAPMVEEFFRFQTIVSDGVPRVAKRDLVLAGATIRAGDAVIISLASANRDEEVFTDPDSLQPHRANVRRHVAFGWGPHRCLGQHLARMELRVALAALTRAIPTLRLAVPVEQLRYGQQERHLDHLKELPVTW